MPVSAERVVAVTAAMTLKQAAPPEQYDDEDLAVLDGILDALVWLGGERATRGRRRAVRVPQVPRVSR